MVSQATLAHHDKCDACEHRSGFAGETNLFRLRYRICHISDVSQAKPNCSKYVSPALPPVIHNRFSIMFRRRNKIVSPAMPHMLHGLVFFMCYMMDLKLDRNLFMFRLRNRLYCLRSKLFEVLCTIQIITLSFSIIITIKKVE